MKINLEQLIASTSTGKNKLPLGKLLEKALFEAEPGVVPDARGVFNKIKDQKKVDLTVEELSALKRASKNLYIEGVYWAIEDVLEGKTKEE